VFLDAGLVNQSRKMTLVGEDSGTEYGEIKDNHLVLQFGLGFQM
jgi:hypothetical protein